MGDIGETDALLKGHVDQYTRNGDWAETASSIRTCDAWRVSDGTPVHVTRMPLQFPQDCGQSYTVDAERLARFESTLDALSFVQDPGVVPAVEVWSNDEEITVVLSSTRGSGTLAAHPNRLLPGEALGQIARAVETLHREGVLLGELDAHDIVFDAGKLRIGVESWVVRALQGLMGPITRWGRIPMDVWFPAPEVVRGATATASSADAFALGGLAYWLITGVNPWPGEPGTFDWYSALVKGHVLRPRLSDPRFPAELESVLLRQLSLDTRSRCATPAAFVSALHDAGLSGLARRS